ncbi:hypothetical protein MTP99_011880 [Tenebrio molitor]|nr:hypothetical protein MTP99_011880 [Tenebrio molitor]
MQSFSRHNIAAPLRKGVHFAQWTLTGLHPGGPKLGDKLFSNGAERKARRMRNCASSRSIDGTAIETSRRADRKLCVPSA